MFKILNLHKCNQINYSLAHTNIIIFETIPLSKFQSNNNMHR